MSVVKLDGLTTRFEVFGVGEPVLMLAPGGFNATIESWLQLGIYKKLNLLSSLPERYHCIAFDRRECGESGGRIERVTWLHYATQAVALLDHLGVEKAHIIGGCMGCSVAAALATMFPDRVASLVLWWPVGGARYRISSQRRFAEHIEFVQKNGLSAVVDLVAQEGKPFGADPRGGPWAAVLKSDEAFAKGYTEIEVDRYSLVLTGMARLLFDRDTSPGAEPEDLLGLAVPTLIVPGNDASHATSAARYMHECLAGSEYWDVPIAEQEDGAAKIAAFLSGHAI
jgi:pimeloyl-ACP methyl ester carboxylesterase